MTDYGMKISHPGTDVKYSTGEDLFFSTGSRTLKIVKEGTFKSELLASKETNTKPRFVYHNLGYVPIFYVVAVEGSYSDSAFFGDPDDNVYTKNAAHIGMENIYIDNEKIIFGGTGEMNFNTGENWLLYKYFIFDTPMIEVIKPDPTTVSDRKNYTDEKDYGIKISKSRNVIKNSHDNNLNSSYSQFTIHMLDSGRCGSTNTEFSLYHNLGYIPVCWIYEYNPEPIGAVVDWNGIVSDYSKPMYLGENPTMELDEIKFSNWADADWGDTRRVVLFFKDRIGRADE